LICAEGALECAQLAAALVSPKPGRVGNLNSACTGSPRGGGSYKARPAAQAAKQMRIEAGLYFIHEGSGAAGGGANLKLD